MTGRRITIYPDTNEYASWDVTADQDLASATVQIYLAGSWRTADWAGTATHSGNTWTRTARILIAGVNGASSIKPDSTNDVKPEWRVTIGDQVIPGGSSSRFEFGQAAS